MAPTPPDCRIRRAAAPLLAAHEGVSCFVLLEDNRHALLARIALVDRAEHRIDLQYYIVRGDLTGLLLVQRLLAAADRGVHVRVLVDDANTAGQDPLIAEFDRHPNVEVRLFNPFRRRGPSVLWRLWEVASSNRHLTRRMHNKALLVDGAVAVVGGRNLGDEYFDAAAELAFHDLDLVVFGPAVAEVGESFEGFWRSRAAHAITALHGRRIEAGLERIRTALAARLREAGSSAYLESLHRADVLADLAAEAREVHCGPAEVLYDDPEQIAPPRSRRPWRRRPRPPRIAPRLAELFESARDRVLLASPYVVPGEQGARFLGGLAARGIRVRLLTNSLAATDVPAVHAGWERYRRRLIHAGVEVHEMRPEPGRPRRRGFGSSAGASLHAKAFAIDGRLAVVGSMNMDPRSAFLNTELGIVVESARLAARIERWFEELTEPSRSYRVTLERWAGVHRLRWDWVDAQGRERVAHVEPEAPWWRRIVAQLVSWLPVEDQL